MGYLIPENLKSRSDVPPGVQRLASALRDGLDDDETVWFEPLFDSTGERPDLVVLIPTRGLLIIEVLEDRASSVRGVRDGKLVVAASEGGERLVEAPLARAQRFADRLRAAIAASPHLSGDPLPVAAIAALPYMSAASPVTSHLEAVLEPRSCCWRDDIELAFDDPTAFRRRLTAALGSGGRDALTPEQEKAYRAIIHPDTVIGTPTLPFPVPDGESEEILRVLDRRQEAVAKGLGAGHRVIRGAAGSGKTLVLLYRARLLSQLQPTRRVLVTCYTRSLAGRLRSQLGECPNVEVTTLDRLMQKARSAGGFAGMNFDNSTDEERATAALEGLAKAPKAVPRYAHVLIDEAQDFPTDALRFAVRLLEDGSDSLLAVADPAQNIFKKTFTWKAAGIQATGRTRWLEQSYRNTREILEYAHGFVTRGGELRVESDPDPEDPRTITEPKLSPRHGPVPLVLGAPSRQGELVGIAAYCRQELDRGTAPNDIAVLYGTQWVAGFNWPVELVKLFEQEGLPIRWYTDPADRKGKDELGADTGKVVLSTIASAKGLEWHTVVLCGYLDVKPPAESRVSRSLVYVGMTRATHRLVLSACGAHPYLADLERL